MWNRNLFGAVHSFGVNTITVSENEYRGEGRMFYNIRIITTRCFVVKMYKTLFSNWIYKFISPYYAFFFLNITFCNSVCTCLLVSFMFLRSRVKRKTCWSCNVSFLSSINSCVVFIILFSTMATVQWSKSYVGLGLKTSSSRYSRMNVHSTFSLDFPRIKKTTEQSGKICMCVIN